jgi:hypothetical protein
MRRYRLEHGEWQISRQRGEGAQAFGAGKNDEGTPFESFPLRGIQTGADCR